MSTIASGVGVFEVVSVFEFVKGMTIPSRHQYVLLDSLCKCVIKYDN